MPRRDHADSSKSRAGFWLRGRSATAAALLVSTALHGALAATFLALHQGPAPYPATGTITVDLVPGVEIFGPGPGSTTGKIDDASQGDGGNDGGAPGTERPVEVENAVAQIAAIQTGMVPETVDPPQEDSIHAAPPVPIEPAGEIEVPVTEAPMPTSPEEAAESPAAQIAALPPATTETQTVMEKAHAPVAFEPPPPRPAREPSVELASLVPPRRPEPLQPSEPASDFGPASAIRSGTRPVGEAMPPSEKTVQFPETGSGDAEPIETASRSTGGKAGAPGDPGGEAGGGSSDGLFVGPGFRLGTAQNPLPRYPSIARRRGIEGRVTLRVQVDAAGRPSRVVIFSSSGHDVLDRAAVMALHKWRFVPAKRAGVTVAGQVDVPVSFRLRD